MAKLLQAIYPVFLLVGKTLSTKFKYYIHLIFFIFSFLLSNSLASQTTIQSVNDGNWNSTNTWQGGAIPTASENATVNNIDTIKSGTTAEVIDLTISSTGKLVVEGTLIVNGNLDMEDSGNDPSELILAPNSITIVKNNVTLSTKVNLNLSSYFIVIGNLDAQSSSNNTNINIHEASIYVFGTVSDKTDLDTCNIYDGLTEDNSEICHVGTETAFNNNIDSIPPEIIAVVVPCDPPAINSHPDATAHEYCLDETASALSISATGENITYQWYRDNNTTPEEGDEIAVGTNNNTFTPSTSTVGTFFYYCIVANSCGKDTSNVSGAITVYGTTITSGTVGGSSELFLCVGGNPGSFSVGSPTGGDGNYTYQWEESDGCSATWTDATAQDGNTSSLTFNPPTLNDTMCYRLKITDGCGNAGYSATKTYNVVPDAISQTINPNPASGTSICVDETVSATFSGGSGGTGTVTDVYEYSTDGGSSWNSYTPGDDINATAVMIGTNMIQIRTRRTATSSGCNFGDWNYAVWTVVPDKTITISSASGTDNQTVNIETPITDITYATTGVMGADFSGLPSGISGSWTSNEVIISGTPTETGTFSYNVDLTGGCGTITATGTINVNNTFDVSTESPGQICNAADGQINYTETDVATPITFTVDMTTGNTVWSPDWEITFTLTPSSGATIDNITTSAGSFTTPGPYRLTNIPSINGQGSVDITLEVTGNIYSDLTVDFEITTAKELQHDTPDKDNDDRTATQTVLAIPNTGEITTN